MKVAWSNDSFELWFVLHFEYLNTGITREQYKEKITKNLTNLGISKYQKNDEKMFDYLYPYIDNAIRYAEKLHKQHSGDSPYSKRNPDTTVHILVKELKSLIGDKDKETAKYVRQ